MKISAKKSFSNGVILNNQEIEIADNKIISIKEISQHSTFDFECVSPGLVDLHINGGEEFHFTNKPTEETIHDIETAALKNGVTHTLPTLITSSFENINTGISAIKSYLKQNPNSGVLGMHLEGPFLNPIKRGAHLEKYLQKPSLNNLQDIIKAGEDYIKIMTIAPELFSDECLELLLNSNIQISAGHSNATFEEADRAFKKGIKLVTHLFNAMSAFGHREPGLVGATFLNPQVFAPIILDGVHVNYNSAKVALNEKREGLFLISDALFQNYKKKEFKWEEFDAVLKDNAYTNSEGNLAGAAISMKDAVKNAITFLNIPLELALKMSTSTPASLIKSNRKFGKIELGYEAKLISFEGVFEKVNAII
jgi:N-acetylglucosamine-6-phosphate deacetylase